MRKKNALLLIVPAVMISALVAGASLDGSSDNASEIGRQFAVENPGATIYTSMTEEAITEEEEIRRTEVIVLGTVSESESYWKIYEDNEFPAVMTRYAVSVEDILKGDLVDKTVGITVFGGTADGIKHVTPSAELAEGDKVLLLLGKDPTSIFGDRYALVSASKSIYVINGTHATNAYGERSGPVSEVIERITSKIG